MSSTKTLVTCSRCRREMRMVDRPPRPNPETGKTPESRRGLHCNHCGHHWCASCHSFDEGCDCGQRNWTKTILVDEEKAHWWDRFFKR